MKTIQAYGGKAQFWRGLTGWNWQATAATVRWSPPRELPLKTADGKSLYIAAGSARGGGWSRKLSDSRHYAMQVVLKN